MKTLFILAALPAVPLAQNNTAYATGVELSKPNIVVILADRASEYIQRRAKTGQPFFLYLPLTSPHTPLVVNKPWQGKSGLDSAVADFIMETDDDDCAHGELVNQGRSTPGAAQKNDVPVN